VDKILGGHVTVIEGSSTTQPAGFKAMSIAFRSRPLTLAHVSGADVCTWATDIRRFEHTENSELLIGTLTMGDLRWKRPKPGREFRLARCRRLAFIPVGTRVEYEAPGPFAATTLHISSQKIEEALDIGNGLAVLERMELSIGSEQPFVAGALAALAQEISHPSQFGSLYAESLVDTLLHASLVVTGGNIPPRRVSGGISPFLLARVKDYIISNLSSELSLSELANVAGLDEHYFCRSFKASTGVSPHRFVTEARVDLARQLLKNTELSLSEIALRVGFSSHSHLSGTFKKVLGVSPSSFRRLV
jgi:AraC-like DNA-binding protein